MVAAVKLLDRYTSELTQIPDETDSLDRNLIGWHLFNRYAFQYPSIFLNLFWGEERELLEDAIADYYEIYPGELKNNGTALFMVSVYCGNIKERDFFWLRRAANDGYFSFEDARLLSELDYALVRSCLLEHQKKYMIPGETEKAIENCNAILDQLYTKYRRK